MGGGGAERRKKGSNDLYIPPEIAEAILINLPVKSLLRFSSVSRLWNSIIFGPRFVNKYRGHEILIGSSRPARYYGDVSTLILSSGLSDNPTFDFDSTTLICPIEGKPYLLAFCDGFLCVQVQNSLFLWNPSTQKYRKLRDPSDPPLCLGLGIGRVMFGLGYDAVGDDYKLLKNRTGPHTPMGELYSLRSDSWRNTQPFPQITHEFCGCVDYFRLFADGVFYWIAFGLDRYHYYIISFDLSTEKFGEAELPQYSPSTAKGHPSITFARGKLCVSIDYRELSRFVIWTREDNVVGQPWTKIFDINFNHGLIPSEMKLDYTLVYLYSYDDGWILVKACNQREALVFICEGDEVLPMNNAFQNFRTCFLYVDRLVSPNMW